MISDYLRQPTSLVEFVENALLFSITAASLPFLLIGLITVFGTILSYLREVIYLFAASLLFHVLFIIGLYAFNWYFEYLPQIFLRPPRRPRVRTRRINSLVLTAAAPNSSILIANPNLNNNNNA